MPDTPETFRSVAEERDRLQIEITDLREQAIESWLATVKAGLADASTARAMERSKSWRITRPLRTLQGIRLRASEIGYGRAVRLAAPYIRNQIQARRRG